MTDLSRTIIADLRVTGWRRFAFEHGMNRTAGNVTLDEFRKIMEEKYYQARNLEPEIYVCSVEDGARVLF